MDIEETRAEIKVLQELLVTMADELTIERAELRGRLLKLVTDENDYLTTQILNNKQ